MEILPNSKRSSSARGGGAFRLPGMRVLAGAVAALGFFESRQAVLAQTASTSGSGGLSQLRVGPFDLHPRAMAGVEYDDNILFQSTNKEADVEWSLQPGLQAVLGDDAALISYRDQNNSVLTLTPGSLIIQPAEDRPGRLLILDYSPRFQFFDKYTANNSVDHFATIDLLWPLDKLIFEVKQEYQLEKTVLIEANARTRVQTIPTTLSLAYQFGDKTSLESDFRRTSVDYGSTNLTGYTEYATEDWFNYQLTQKLNTSLGAIIGWDSVPGHLDQTYEQFRARARYYYTEKLSFDASVGGEVRQYQSGRSDTFTPVFNVTAQYFVGPRTWLQLIGAREPYAAIFNGFNYTITSATLDLTQQITDRFKASVDIGYFAVDYVAVAAQSTTHNDNYYNGRVAFDAKIVRHLTAEASYQVIDRASHFYGSLVDNQMGLQLTLSY